MLAESGKQPASLRGQISVLAFVRMTLDPVVIVAAFFVCTLAVTGTFRPPDLVLGLIVFSLTFPGNLALTPGARGLFREILISWTVIVAILLFFGWATGFLGWYDEEAIGIWMAATPLLLYGAHRVVPVVLPRVLAVEGYRTAVIAGLTESGRRLAERFEARAWLGVKVLGFFDDRDGGAGDRIDEVPAPGLKGKLADLPAFVKEAGVEAIFITLPMGTQPRILWLLEELRDTTASIYFVPDIFLYDIIQARVDDIDGVPVVAVCETPFYGVNGLVKRISDIVLAALILVLTAPLMLAIAVGVKLSSPGPVIFRQRRYGLDGKEIVIYKFRTMRVMEDGGTIPQARKGDQRVTRFGACLRRLSLDELPQFVNVLQGRMSVVGPRPHAVAHNELYRKVIKGYMVRHKVKPGITGLAQVSGARGETDTVEKMQRRIELDLAYLRNWSLRLDLEIILKTIPVLIRGQKNAY
ncbi:MAG: undecaprenyl-phosphate glucose phosphotransferase [Burkholderiales bacterium]|nr:undecaprenyl-phosphate glucose phosphotransferase [Burkholderiales bacterium]